MANGLPKGHLACFGPELKSENPLNNLRVIFN